METLYFGYGSKLKHPDIKEFICTNDVPLKPNAKSKEYLETLYKIGRRNKKLLCVLYFMKVMMGMQSMATMFVSCQKVRDLIASISSRLYRKAVTEEWEPTFDKYISDTLKRLDYVMRIMRENIYLTEYYPFFAEVGFDTLFDFDMHGEDIDGRLEEIKQSFESWKEGNLDKIDAHMRKTESLRTALDEEKARNKENDKLEKEERKAARKKETDEVREIRFWQRQHEKEERKIEKEMRRYYG